MQRRIEANGQIALWVERIVWNAAAGAAVAVMILVLLGSLRWLDEISPRTALERPEVSAEGTPRNADREQDRPAEVAGLNRPAG